MSEAIQRTQMNSVQWNADSERESPPSEAPELPPPPEALMRNVFLLMGKLAADIRHSGEDREAMEDKRELDAEAASIQALRDKADATLAEGIAGGIADIGSSAVHAIGSAATTNEGKEWANAGDKLTASSGKVFDGIFKAGVTRADLEHEQAQNTVENARKLAKRAADMVSDGSGMSSNALQEMKQCFDRILQSKASIHYA
jgi:hypothetical protein